MNIECFLISDDVRYDLPVSGDYYCGGAQELEPKPKRFGPRAKGNKNNNRNREPETTFMHGGGEMTCPLHCMLALLVLFVLLEQTCDLELGRTGSWS